MNKIFKSIWNNVTRTFTAVSEVQQTNGKKAKSAVVSSVSASAIMLSCVSPTYGYDSNLFRSDSIDFSNNSFYIGNNNQPSIKHETSTPLNNYGGDGIGLAEITLAAPSLSDIGGSTGLLQQGLSGYRQLILTSDRLWDVGDAASMFNTSNVGSLTQKLSDSSASLHYATGGNAYDLLVRNQDSLSSYISFDIRRGSIYFNNDSIANLGYTDDGVAWDTGNHISTDDGYKDGLFLLTFLTGIEVHSNLTLDMGANDAILAPVISGDGSLTLKGSGTINIRGVLTANIDGSAYQNANTHTGGTVLEGVSQEQKLTVQLNKESAFGNVSSVLTATNAVINVNRSDAWTSAGGLHLTDSTVNFTAEQSEFTVTNNPGDTPNTATFSGANTISGDSNPFTYLIQGDAEVVGGKTTFTNNIITKVAGSLTLHSVDGIANSNGIQIGESLNFVGAGNATNQQPLTQHFSGYHIDGYTVKLSDGSNIKYTETILTGVSSTELSNASKLETDTQANLGSLVTFAPPESINEARSQLTLTSTGDLTLTSSLSGDGLTILQAGGKKADETIAEISLGSNLSGYSGWIRLEQGEMDLTEVASGLLTQNGQTGLSLGQSSALKVSGNTTRKLDRFGWQSDTGVLDLTDFDFTDQFEGALSVKNLLYPTGGIIKLDVQEVAGDVPTDISEGSVFALDDGQAGQLLIETTLPSEDISTIEFQDKDGNELEKSRNQNYYSQNDSTGRSVAAVGSWSWTVRYHDNVQNSEGETVNGIYASYALDKLTLTNGTEDGNNGPLLASAALVGETTAQSYRLNTQIDGRGIFEIKAGKEATDNKFVQLNNQKNSYTGATVVLGSTELQYVVGALGNSTVILSGEDANLKSPSRNFDGETISGNQVINGLYTDSAQHTITLGQGTTLTIAGNANENWSEEAETKYFGGTAPTQNVLGAETKLSGLGIFSIGTDGSNDIQLTAESSDAFNEFSGTIKLAGNGSSLTINAKDAQDKLSGGKFATTNNAANAAVTVNTDATIGDNNANFSGYKGTLNTTNHIYTVTSTTALGGSSIVASGSTIVFSGVTDNAITNRVTKSDPSTSTTGVNRWVLTNASNVTLNNQSASQTGYDIVEIAGGTTPSTLTLVYADDNGSDKGGLSKLSSDVAFVGNGNLNLSGYELNSDDLNFTYGTNNPENFTGTLGLTGSTEYTLLSNAAYGIALNTGTLVVGSSTVQSHLTAAELSFTGTNNVLDLSNAAASTDTSALFTVKGAINRSADTDKLTVQISENQRSEEVKNKNILDQDDGTWDQWLVNAETIGNIASNNVEIRVGEIALHDFTQNIASSGTATGYYKASGIVEKGDIGASYELMQIDFEAGSLLGLDTTSANNNTLAVALTGTGTIDINGDITVNNTYTTESGLAQAAFTGKYAVGSGSTLTLSGYGVANVDIDLQSGAGSVAGVVIASDQTATINANSSGGGKVEFADGENALTLTLTGNSTLQSGSALVSQNTNDRIVLSDGASSSEETTLHLAGAHTALTGYKGTITLGKNSTLKLDKGSDSDPTVNLDRVFSVASGSGTVDLASGTYEITSDSDYTGAWNVQDDSRLNLNGIGSKDSLAEFNNVLTPSQESGGVIALTNGSGIAVGSNAANFRGTWDLATSASVSGEKLKVDGTLDAAEVTLGENDELAYSTSETGLQTISTSVNSGRTAEGTFKVSGGKYIIAEGTQVKVGETDVVSGASLKASLDQLGNIIKITNDEKTGATSTVRVEVNAQDSTLEFKEREVSGDGVLHIDLNGGTLDFAEGTGVVGNSIKVRLSDAIYSYVKDDGFTSYVVGSNGRFKVEGTNAASLTTVGWDYSSNTETQSGIIDLSGFDFAATDSAAIDANYIALSHNNVVQIDTDHFISTGAVTKGGIMSLDDMNPDKLLIAGTRLDANTGRDLVTLLDEDGQRMDGAEGQPDQVSYLDSKNDHSQKAAKLDWGMGAKYYEQGESGVSESGIYLNYGVQKITLLNGSQSDTPVSGGLSVGAALVAEGNAANSQADNMLNSLISGHGILEFAFEGTKEGGNVVELGNDSNSYTGATVVRENTTLKASANALGDSTLVLIRGNSNFVLDVASASQALDGIVTDDNAHEINIGDNNLTLQASKLIESDVTAFKSGYGVDIEQTNTLGTNTSLTGSGTLTLNSDLTAKSALAFNSFAGTVAIGQEQTLTIESATNASNVEISLHGGEFTGGTEAKISLNTSAQIGAIEDGTGSNEGISGADFSGFTGQLSLTNKEYNVYDLGKLGLSELVLSSSAVEFNGITGEFKNEVTSNGIGGTWNLENSNITLNGSSGTKEGFDNVSIVENSTLTLINGTNDGGLGLFGKSDDGDTYAVTFGGDGRLNLSGFTMLQSNQIKWGNFEGIVGLQGTTNFTQIGQAAYGVDLATGTTLTASGEDVKVDSFNFAGNATLDLIAADNNGSSSALFTSTNGYTGSGDLTVEISQTQFEDSSKSLLNSATNILDQDEDAGVNWIVAAGDAEALKDENTTVSIKVGGKDLEPVQTVELQKGVKGTYTLGTNTTSDDIGASVGIGVNYKLTALNVTTDASDFKLDAGSQTQADLAVRLTGVGSIGISGTIEVAYQGESNFGGTYALAKDAHLILSGNTSGIATVDFGSDTNTGADLTLNSAQRLVLGTVGAGSNVTLRDGVILTVQSSVDPESKNVFAGGATLIGGTNTGLALDKSANLVIENVSETFAHFDGLIGLRSGAHLTLTEGSRYSLDDIISNASDSTVTLGEGSYSLSKSTYKGAWELGNSAELNLDGNVSFTADGAKLSSAEDVADTTKPNVNVGQGVTVTSDAGNLVDFEAGTFALSSGSTLHINAKADAAADAFLNSDVNVSGTGTLELAGDGTFNSDVTADTFRVASGNVTLGEVSIGVSNTAVGAGASLTAAKNQIGNSSLTIGESGVLNVTVGKETGSFAQKISGKGTLHVDLGGTENILDFSDSNIGRQTTIIVANGTHTYDMGDSFSNYGVDDNGVFKVGETPIGSVERLLGSFTWQGQGGELDLSGITYTGVPAMTVDKVNIHGDGQIKLDLDSWVADLEEKADGNTNLLDADDGVEDNYVLVVKGEVDHQGTLTLVDQEGNPVTDNQEYQTTTTVGDDLADAIWNYSIVTKPGSEDPVEDKGLALTYGVTELHLKNMAADKNAVILKPDGGDSEFSALISGEGKLSIQGDVALSHSDNSFTNSTITVESGNKLTTQGSNVLGSGSNTLKLDNANYEMASLADDAYSETIKLDSDGNSSITLNGNQLNLADGSTISSETTFGGNTESNADSALTALGEVTLEGASQTLGNLGVAGLKLAIDATGNVKAAGGSIEKLENISGEGKFTLALNPNQQATAGGLTDFTGTVVAGSSQTLVLNEDSKTETVKVDLSNGGTLTSSTESTIAGLTTTSDSVIDLGGMTVGGEASGMLTVTGGDSTLAAGTELKVEVKTETASDRVLSLDDGMITKLVTGLDATQTDDFTVNYNSETTGDLLSGKDVIGTAHYIFEETVVPEENNKMTAGLKSTLTKIELTGKLVLNNNTGTPADLAAEVQGTNESAVTVSFGEIELVKDNSYGQLNVSQDATANLTGDQTITGTGGVVSGHIVASEGNLKLAEDAGLTFKAVQSQLADISLNDGATLTLSGINAVGNGSLLGATKLNVVDDTGNLQIVDSTGLLDDENLGFPTSPDYKATALYIAVQTSEVTLSDNWVDITDNLSMNVTGGSSVAMTGKASDTLSVNWSNLTVDQNSSVTLNGNGAALTFTGLNEGKLAGTININNVGFEFGANTAGKSVNNDLLESANVTFSNSDLVANGVSNVGNLTLDSDSTLAFQESKQIAMGDKSSSLITVAEDKTLNLGGATIKIDTDDLSFDFKDTESGTTSAPLLNALNDAQQENVKYFQLVEGNVSGLGKLTDMNGNALVDTSAVTVIDEDGKTVAELGFGAKLQQGEGGKDLWVGQGLQTLSLFKSVELNAGDGKGLTLDGNGVFTINAVIEASDKADDMIDLTIAGNTPIRLAGANGNITGTTTVAEDGKLVLANNNTLGSLTDLDVQGTLEIETGFTQSAETLNVSGTGTLDLAEGAKLKLDVTTAPEESASAIIGGTVTGSGTLAFAENAQVHIAETAKLNGVTWDLTKGAAMVIAARTNGQSITSGTISGGTVLKNGTGDLTLGYGVVNNNGVAVDVQEGNLKIDGWTNTLTLKSLNLHASEFTMFGNLATADGLSSDGARITLGASDTDFKDYTIDGLYSGSATFVFDTALGETSDGDSLTFAAGVAEGSHALVEVNNHTTLRPSMSVADLTLISVNGEVAEDFATLQGGNLSKDGFDWGLVAKEGENGYTDFYLSAEAGSDPSDPTDPSKPVYKMDARVGALAGFAASVDLFEMTIHDRQGTRAWINPITGEKTTTSLWMRQTMSKSDSSDSSGQFGGRSDDRATTIGGDILQLSPSGSGLVYAGLMAGFGSSDYDANSSVTGASAKADTDAWMVGAYAGWNQNDPKNDRTGAYLAGWVQYAHFSSDIVRSGEKKLDAKASGLSASLEAGWIVKAAEFQMQGGATEGAFYIEPHAQVTWWGTDYDNIDGENIEFEGQHNITTRLGARLTMETSGATNFSPYLEANWVHNTKEYGVQWGEAESYIEGTQNQAELKFGAETFFTDSFSGYAQIRANWGGDGYNRQEGSLGLKYRF